MNTLWLLLPSGRCSQRCLPVDLRECRARPAAVRHYHTEDCSVGPDPQRQRNHHHKRKSGRLPQQAESIPQILAQVIEPGPAPGAVDLFADLQSVAELSLRRVPRFLRINCAFIPDFPRAQLAMQSHFLLQLAIKCLTAVE